MQNTQVAVIGGGSWATALVKLLSHNVGSVKWWLRNSEVASHINNHRHNPRYLNSVSIAENVEASNDLNKTISRSTAVFLAVPAAFVVETLRDVPKEVIQSVFTISAIKGLIPKENLTVSEYLHQKFDLSQNNFGVIGGPCHAEEVASEKLSYLTAGARLPLNSSWIKHALECEYIKISESQDVIGIEFASTIKNIIAVMSGICHGLGYGDNFQAVLVSNGIQEIERIRSIFSQADQPINNSVYLGDLLVTTYSQYSRNRTFGTMIGKGYSVKSAQLEMNMIAEGYYATKSVYERCLNTKIDLTRSVVAATYNILYQDSDPQIEVQRLALILS